MKTIAYVCDNCKKLALAEYIYGIHFVGGDLFNHRNVYKIMTNPKQCNLHVCSECITGLVYIPMEKMKIKKGTDEFHKTYNELIQNTMASIHRKTKYR